MDEWSNMTSNIGGGIPRNFDYSLINSKERALEVLFCLPERDKARFAHKLYELLPILGADLVYDVMIYAYTHYHQEIFSEFKSDIRFARALRKVKRPKIEKNRIQIYRGFLTFPKEICSGGFDAPLWHAFAISWTTRIEVASWFACRRKSMRDSIPIVVQTVASPAAICDICNDRNEAEVIVDPCKLHWPAVTIEGTQTAINTLTGNAHFDVPNSMRWQELGNAYEAEIQANALNFLKSIGHQQSCGTEF
jgi:hypothetical protein